MKTKKTILIFAGLLLYASSIMAQTYYYNTTKTFYENGYTYQCDARSGEKSVTLYNKSNQYTYATPTFKDGSPISRVYWDSFPELLEDDDWTKPYCYYVINSAFSAAERQRTQGRKIGISMYINPATGDVLEVDFWFIMNGPFATIPVSVYRSIETGIKSSVWFTPTAEGKKLNYIMLSWMHEVKEPGRQPSRPRSASSGGGTRGDGTITRWD